MNKALQRLKKRREKSEESANKKQDNNDILNKSIKIKNMAELLEGQMNQSQQNVEGNDNNNNTENEIKKEENDKEEDSPLDNMIDLMQNQNVMMKRKKTKKKFEE